MPETPQYSEEDMQINAESADINEVTHDKSTDPDLNKDNKNGMYKAWEKTRSKLGTPEYVQARQEYLESCIENPYQQFVTEFGSVKGSNLKEYLKSWRNFENFINQQKVPNTGQRYDLGRRFSIDALLNNEDSIADDEQTYIRDFLMNIMPYYNHEARAINKEKDSFFNNYPDPEKLVETLSYLFKKAEKQIWLTSPAEIWAGMKEGGFSPEDREKYKAWLDTLYEKSTEYESVHKGPYTDSTWNSSLLFTMSWLLKQTPEGQESLDNAYKDFPNEFFEEAESQFECDFRPPE